MNSPHDNRSTRRPPALLLRILAVAAASAVSSCASPRQPAVESRPPERTPNHPARQVADLYFLEGSVLQMLGRCDDALVRYQRAMTLAPRLAPVRFAMARCLQSLGRRDSALARIEEALALDPENIDVRLLAAELMVANGRPRDGAEQYEQIVRRRPDHVQARYNAARLQQRGNPERAIEHYEYIRHNITSDYNTLLNLADMYTNRRQYDQSIDAMRELLLINPGDPELYGILTTTYLLAGRFAEASGVLGEALRHIPSDSLATAFLLARTHPIVRARTRLSVPGMQDFARALADRLAAVDSNPQALYGATMLRYLADDDAGADTLLVRTLAHPGIPLETWSEAVRTYIDAGHSNRALPAMLGPAARFKAAPEALHLIGCAFFATGRLDSAEKYLRRSVALEPDNADAWSRLGAIHSRLGRPAAAESAYRQAIAQAPDDAALANNFAYSLARFNRRLDLATTLIDRALAAEPENESFLDTKGWVLFRLGEYNGALQYIQRSIAVGGAGAEAYEHLGDVHTALGDPAAARVAYDHALRLDPGNTELRRKRDAAGSPEERPAR